MQMIQRFMHNYGIVDEFHTQIIQEEYLQFLLVKNRLQELIDKIINHMEFQEKFQKKKFQKFMTCLLIQ